MDKKNYKASLIGRRLSVCFRLATALALILMVLALPGFKALSSDSKDKFNDNGYLSKSVALAPPITVNAGWAIFTWNGSGPVFNAEGPFTFTSAAPTLLKVTDIACKGDQFAVLDSGIQIGTTPAVPVGLCPGPIDEFDPDIAYADPTYSHGVFQLAPGSHSITIQLITNPFSGGGAYLRVDSAFDICLQGDGNGNILVFNSTTGDYQFTNCTTGLTLIGAGALTVSGCTITLQHIAADRKITASVNTCLHKGSASVLLISPRRLSNFTITDSNTANNTCVCP